LNNGVFYYAINKATGEEEDLGSRADRTKYIGLNLYENPRDEKVNKMKPEILKILSILYTQNGEIGKAKEAFAEVRKMLPNDEELKTGEFNLYFNEGYAGLAKETQLVDDINSAGSDKKKFDALILERKEMFMNVLPLFEKAYSINSADENTKNILKMAYDVIGQPEKAKAIK
jgi:tetratricopeptide (TPR) repeat protein